MNNAPAPLGSRQVGIFPGRVDSLDGLRALAVFAVVAYHADLPLTIGGYIGVDVFFVLSGVLITTLLMREKARFGFISLKLFYLRRALRLFPAVIVVSAVTALAWWLVPFAPLRSETLWGTVAAVTYLSSWVRAFDISTLAYMGHTWSLAVEEAFYVVWPLAIIGFYRIRANIRNLVIAAAVVGILYRLAAPTLFGWSSERIYNAPDTRAEQILIGCALAVILGKSAIRVPFVYALASGAVLAAAAMFVPLDSVLYSQGGSTIIGLAAAVVIAHLWTDTESPLARLLRWTPLVWVGRRSYGIYLWHRPIFGLLFGAGLPLPVLAALGLVLTLAIPAFSFKYIEEPLLRVKDRMQTRGKAKC